MTLSRWFRDYLYIPLGGNWRGYIRTFFNLWIVFFLCGLWHGAGLTFIIWGLYHGLLLIIERAAHGLWQWRPSGLPGIAASFVLVTIGWVFFRAPTIADAMHYLGAMFLLEPHSAAISSETIKLTPDILFLSGARLDFRLCSARSTGGTALGSYRRACLATHAVHRELCLLGHPIGRQQFQSVYLFSLLIRPRTTEAPRWRRC